MKEFSIYPSYQLLEKESEEYFYVENVDEDPDGSGVSKILHNLRNNLSNQPESIVTNSNFDPLYNLIKVFSDLGAKNQERLVRLLCQCLDSLIESCSETLREVKSKREENNQQRIEIEQYGIFRNSLKMYVYLLYNYATTYDFKTTGKSKKTFRQEKKWKDVLLKTFHSILQWNPRNLERLWPTNKPEDEYFLLFFNLCNSFLVDPELAKDRICKKSVFDILSLFFAERQQSDGEVEMLVKAIVSKGHVGNSIIEYIETQNPEEHFLNQLILEIGQFDTKSLENESIKNYSRLLPLLAKTIPEQVVKNMSVIVGHLQDKWYTIRNAVIECLTELIANYFKQNTKKKSVRDRFLEIFVERLKDSNAYTRSKTIQCLTELYTKQALPNSYRLHIFPLIIARMRDKRSTVRKSAISFVTSAINNNPYGGVLKLSKYELDLVEARKKLRDYEVENRIHHKEEKDLGGEDSDEDEDDTKSTTGPQSEDSVGDSSLNTVYLKLQKIYRYYADATRFIVHIHHSLDEVGTLLNSQQVSDLKEAIRLIVCCHDYQVEDSLKYVGRFLPLVWSEEVVDHVTGAFKEIFLKRKMVNAEVCMETATYLLRFISQAKIVEIQAVTTMVIDLIRTKIIRMPLILAFWENYIPKNVENSSKRVNVNQQIAAAIFLEMVAQAKPKAIVQRFMQIVHGILTPGCNVFLAIHTCRILYHLRKTRGGLPTEDDTKFLKKGGEDGEDNGGMSSDSEESESEDEDEEGGLGGKDKVYNRPLKAGKDFLVLPIDHIFFETLLRFLTERDFPISPWCSYAKELVRVIFALSYQPKAIMSYVFDVLREKVEVLEITKVIFLLGESCMRELELVIAELRSEKDVLKKENKKQLEEAKKDENISVEEVKRSNEKKLNDLEDTYFNKEQEIIHTESIYLLYYNFILDIVADKNRRFGNSLFRKVALHALGRYMVVNRLLCQKNLAVVFELVLREKDLKSPISIKKKILESEKMEDEDSDKNEEKKVEEETKEKEQPQPQQQEEDGQKPVPMQDEDEDEDEDEEIPPETTDNNEGIQESPKQTLDEVIQDDEEEEQKRKEEAEYEETTLSLSTEIRCNLILQIGDLFYRWTSELTNWREEFYLLLSSSEGLVRHNALVILSNLILNDMVKTSSQMGQIAKCIVDKESRIGLRAKAFFRELGKKKEGKSNPVYNLLPDIFSSLSVSKEIKRNEFEEIMSHLFQYIRKEHQRIQLVKRFCERFKRTTDEVVWKYLSYCLLELRIQKDKIFRVVINSFKHYKNALSCDEVADDLLKVSMVVKKKTKDEVFKNEIGEWEENLKKTHRKLSGKNENEEVSKQQQQQKKGEGQEKEKMVDEDSNVQTGQPQQHEVDGESKKKKVLIRKKERMIDEDEDEEEIEGEGVSSSDSDSDFDIVQQKGKMEKIKEGEDQQQSQSEDDEDQEKQKMEESEDDIILDDDEDGEKTSEKTKKRKRMVDEDESESEDEDEIQSSSEDEDEDEDVMDDNNKMNDE